MPREPVCRHLALLVLTAVTHPPCTPLLCQVGLHIWVGHAANWHACHGYCPAIICPQHPVGTFRLGAFSLFILSHPDGILDASVFLVLLRGICHHVFWSLSSFQHSPTELWASSGLGWCLLHQSIPASGMALETRSVFGRRIKKEPLIFWAWYYSPLFLTGRSQRREDSNFKAMTTYYTYYIQHMTH